MFLLMKSNIKTLKKEESSQCKSYKEVNVVTFGNTVSCIFIQLSKTVFFK